ncbi:solute carrier family 2, facilitated glucose transporter member 1 isoform X1 [Apis mellifera caucasica]|uniref:Solute carrier family 2, facilitated glucose transporter member 1 isoform X1 n=3 Tax=Apis mellifera TaxID=7460 RepID=A0A7M7GKF1_APIME|nr:solute carrier family 2, facilitated glucose transporter member 1 isoform X1 [Apis mellifera]XP_006557779.1 solute carrier family 2, facilitated glucose transporter member 1 isoform X2 [Apis mellifera]KAG6796178.1 solute carrier family 2, facilitated glucose transporter member 1 isoform X1 [Apis mellifera caucasica]KAG9427903.1 solute carrier family 2, facilitated glucose transporter member 1 isoform X1 [Apis mellifera carnica]|eukprot:XP_006557778.1 solute carrier family 2, facilitated glucose transporter member 1 isoform X1 [Apis mellifera]
MRPLAQSQEHTLAERWIEMMKILERVSLQNLILLGQRIFLSLSVVDQILEHLVSVAVLVIWMFQFILEKPLYLSLLENCFVMETENDKSSNKIQEQATTSTPSNPVQEDKKLGLNGRLAFAIAAAALGSSFQHGYNTGVVNAPQQLIEDWISNLKMNRTGQVTKQSEVTMIWSIAVSIFCVGGMIGGSLVGSIADRFGRKGGLLINNILVLLTVIFEGCAKTAKSYEMIIIGRFLIGINAGLNAGLAPMYLSEISPIHLRGAVGTVYQLVITMSILVSQILGLEQILGTAEQWPLLLCLTIVPAIFQVIALPFCPESPKYLLVTRGKDMEAQRALAWLRGTIEVHDEMEEMRTEYESVKLVPKVTLKELFVNSTLRIPLIIALMVMFAQQLSGINAVMFFSTKIFMMAQLDKNAAQNATLGVGAMNVLMTFISLILVERAGRKTLMLIGFSGMFVDTALLAICLAFAETSRAAAYFSIVLVIMFVVLFATGPGSIPWFLVSELFNQSARPAATSVAIAVNWTANFIVSIGFLPLQEALGAYVFIIFAALQAFFVFFIYKKVPETKNKTMEEISSMFRQISYQ